MQLETEEYMTIERVNAVREMYGINRIDEFIKNCNLNGWLVNAIDIQNRIEIHEKINEEIRFD